MLVVLLGSMTSPHPLVAWLEGRQADEPGPARAQLPDQLPAQVPAPRSTERSAPDDRARARLRVRRTRPVSRVRYG